MAEAGIKPTRYYLKNINLVLSQLSNYVGPLNFRAIKNHIVTKDENDINSIQPGLYKDKNKEEHNFIKDLMNMELPNDLELRLWQALAEILTDKYGVEIVAKTKE